MTIPCVDPNAYLGMGFSCPAPPLTLDLMREIGEWCDQCVGVYRRDWARGANGNLPYRFWFKREEDATLFILRWSNAATRL